MKLLCAFSIWIAAAATLSAQAIESKLVSSDRVPLDQLGFSVAISGGIAVVGAPGKDGGKGAAYVFQQSSGGWTQVTRLDPGDGAAGDQFGYSVSISGDIALVGAPGKDNSAGAFYVFFRSFGFWSRQAELTLPGGGPGDQFGAAIAVDGDIVQDNAIVGAPGRLGGVGVAAIFARSGSTWTLVNLLAPPFTAIQNHFGVSVAISGGTALAGAPGENSNAGSVHVYTNTIGFWTEQADLTIADAAAGDLLGSAVSLDGDTAVIGAPGKSGTGAAFAMIRAGTTWSLQGNLKSPFTNVTTRSLGNSVSVKGDTALVGDASDNQAWLFIRSPQGWLSPETFTSADSDNFPDAGPYANSVAMGNGVLLIGATGTDCTRQPQLGCVGNDPRGAAFAYTPRTIATIAANIATTVSATKCLPSGNLALPVQIVDWVGFTCSLTFHTPVAVSAGVRNVFDKWDDNITTNPRQLTDLGPGTHTAQFHLEYLTAITASPSSAGTVTGAGFHTANTIVPISATPNPGFLFTGFTGDLTSSSSSASLKLDGPKTVIANFVLAPAPNLGALITSKTGTPADRVWTISVSNTGPGTASSAQINGMMVTQTFGTPCTVVRLSPASFPIQLGDIASGAAVSPSVQYDFSTCAANARFTATIVFTSTAGSFAGAAVLVNQLQ